MDEELKKEAEEFTRQYVDNYARFGCDLNPYFNHLVNFYIEAIKDHENRKDPRN